MSEEMTWRAKLQLRPFKEDLYKFIIKQLQTNNILITDEKKLKEGLDIYITSAEFAIKLGKLFRKKYNGEVKVTRSLTGQDRKTLRRIYKLTVLMRLQR